MPDTKIVKSRYFESGLVLLPLSLFISLLDQFTKGLASFLFTYAQPYELTAFLNIFLLHNEGAAFSFLSNAGGWQRWFFSILAVLVSLYIVWVLRQKPWQNHRLFCLGLALILGGAVGNVIDRLALGFVVDFIDFHAFDWHFPAFNVADIAISVGVVFYILDAILNPDPKKAESPAEPEQSKPEQSKPEQSKPEQS